MEGRGDFRIWLAIGHIPIWMLAAWIALDKAADYGIRQAVRETNERFLEQSLHCPASSAVERVLGYDSQRACLERRGYLHE